MNKLGKKFFQFTADAVIDIAVTSMGYPSISGSYQPPQPAGLKEYAEKRKKKKFTK